ncbi:hypothetical protein BGZ60DRAFT_526416 [Tricladium varicosporioides]|nr:hypothetical protein BGZ60DRAFT_526416 [Hymenoscyphus varicosporioides]
MAKLSPYDSIHLTVLLYLSIVRGSSSFFIKALIKTKVRKSGIFAAVLNSGTESGFSSLSITSLATSKTSISPPVPTFEDEANFCWYSWNTYNSISRSVETARSALPLQSSIIPAVVVTITNEVYLNYDVPLTTLCDNYPRQKSKLTSATRNRTTTKGPSTKYFRTGGPTLTAAPPSCTVENDSPECSRLYTSHKSIIKACSSTSVCDWQELNYYHTPPCTTEYTPRACPSGNCVVVGYMEEATMYYWPVTTVNGDFCRRDGTTVTPTSTDEGRPNTVEFGDMTFTSPSAYIILPTHISAIYSVRARRYNDCAPTGTSITVTAEPSDLRTVTQQGPVASPTFEVDWDDFNTVRLEAYKRAIRRNGYGRSYDSHPGTIYDYTPRFQMPISAMGGDALPDWQNCTGGLLFSPKMVPIEPGMTTSLSEAIDGFNRHKAVSTAKPTATPTHRLPWSTIVTQTSIPGPTSEADIEEERADFLEGIHHANLQEIEQ